MTSTNRVVANALMSLEELLKKQGLSRAEFDKMMKEMKDKGASVVHYMRGKDGRLLFKADGTTIGNGVARNASGLDGLIADLNSGKYDSINWMPKVIGKGSLYPDGMKFPSGFGYDDEKKVRQAWMSGKYASVIVYKGGSKRGELTINSRACNSTNPIVRKAMNACGTALNANAVNGPTNDEATIKRDIEQSLRKMSDFAAKFTGAKTTPSSALNDPMYSGYIELTFPTEEESANFNPYYLINKLGDDKSLLPRWAWGIYGFNYNRNGRTWRIKIGRFAT